MEQDKKEQEETRISDLVQGVVLELEERTGPSPWYGQGKEETIEILNQTENHLKTFFEKGDRTPLNELLDSNPAIEDFLIKKRIFYSNGSILSHMHKRLDRE